MALFQLPAEMLAAVRVPLNAPLLPVMSPTTARVVPFHVSLLPELLPTLNL